MLKKQWLAYTFGLAGLISFPAQADLMADVHALQTGWAKTNYTLEEDAQKLAFDQLVTQAQQVTSEYASAPEGWVWLGIIQSTYAGVAGPFDALSFAEGAKASFEKGIEINGAALHGAAYTSLGTLYFKVPGWPLGFGDDDKAAELLKKGVELNPDGIDSHYFYADYLIEQDEYKQAKAHLLKAQSAPARPNRPLADQGRQGEIKILLKMVNEELN